MAVAVKMFSCSEKKGGFSEEVSSPEPGHVEKYCVGCTADTCT